MSEPGHDVTCSFVETNVKSWMSEKQKSLIVSVKNEYLQPNKISWTLEKLADLKDIHELKFRGCSVKSGVAQVLEEMKKSQRKVTILLSMLQSFLDLITVIVLPTLNIL